MPIGPARMPLLDHLGELRMRITRVVVVLAVAIYVFYMAAPVVSQFLLAPIADFLPNYDGTAQLVVLDPFEGFSVRFTIALWTALVATSPVILWQFLAFFLPALKPNERKWFVPIFSAAVALFILGTVFCYALVLHSAFSWLTYQATSFASLAARATSFINIIIKFEIGFGLAFELPLIVFCLVVFDLIPYKKLRGAWRGIYVGLLVVTAMVTPDASPTTMLFLFAALALLYELSLFTVRLVLRARIRQREAIAKTETDRREIEEIRESLGEKGAKKSRSKRNKAKKSSAK